MADGDSKTITLVAGAAAYEALGSLTTQVFDISTSRQINALRGATRAYHDKYIAAKQALITQYGIPSADGKTTKIPVDSIPKYTLELETVGAATMPPPAADLKVAFSGLAKATITPNELLTLESFLTF
jgi:hypothetical protein